MDNELAQKFRSLANDIITSLRLYSHTNEDFLQFYNFYKYIRDNNIFTYRDLISFANSLIQANIVFAKPAIVVDVAHIKAELCEDVEVFTYKLNNLGRY